MTDPNARNLIQQLATAIEAESRERTISHDLISTYIKACDYLAQTKAEPAATEVQPKPAAT